MPFSVGQEIRVPQLPSKFFAPKSHGERPAADVSWIAADPLVFFGLLAARGRAHGQRWQYIRQASAGDAEEAEGGGEARSPPETERSAGCPGRPRRHGCVGR